MNIPNDCLVVKPKKDISPFTYLTWNSHNCPKTIPLDIYKLKKHKLDIVDDPHSLVLQDKAEPTPEEKPMAKSTFERPVDIEKEVKDVTDALLDGDIVKAGEETKDLIKKVKASGKGKNKKR